MRPRHHTAENIKQMTAAGNLQVASMRPRHHTAENGDKQAQAAELYELQ